MTRNPETEEQFITPRTKGTDMLQETIDKLWNRLKITAPVIIMLKHKVTAALQKEGLLEDTIDHVNLFELRPDGTFVYRGQVLGCVSAHLLPAPMKAMHLHA